MNFRPQREMIRSMRRTFFYARRTVAVLIVLVVIWIIASVVVAVIDEPLGGSILLLFLALLGGLLFLLWAFLRMAGGIIRFVAGPSRKNQRGGLGSEYEKLVRAPQSGRWRR